MADGLHNLHTLQGKDYPGGPFVHQDVKAANVFLTLHADGTIKKASIGDFGLVESFAQIQSHRLFNFCCFFSIKQQIKQQIKKITTKKLWICG